MTKQLSKTELQLIAQLLEMAADQYANHGCNDFELDNTLDNKDFLIAMAGEMFDKFDYEDEIERISKSNRKTIFTYDWMVAKFLSKRCCELFNE